MTSSRSSSSFVPPLTGAAIINLAERREQLAVEREVAEILALAATVADQLAALDADHVFGFSLGDVEPVLPAQAVTYLRP